MARAKKKRNGDSDGRREEAGRERESYPRRSSGLKETINVPRTQWRTNGPLSGPMRETSVPAASRSLAHLRQIYSPRLCFAHVRTKVHGGARSGGDGDDDVAAIRLRSIGGALLPSRQIYRGARRGERLGYVRYVRIHKMTSQRHSTGCVDISPVKG